MNLQQLDEARIHRRRRLERVLDAGLVCGLALIVFGCWQIYRPLGPIAAGVLIVTSCWFLSYAPARRENK